jgi:hypothetical protein
MTTLGGHLVKEILLSMPRNAYSDFFFDSSQLVGYISEHNLPDSIANRMTSFYNTRNYQFAWFSSAGVTEQGRGFWNMYKYFHNHEPEKLVAAKTLLKSMDRLVADDDTDWKGRDKKTYKNRACTYGTFPPVLFIQYR